VMEEAKPEMQERRYTDVRQMAQECENVYVDETLAATTTGTAAGGTESESTIGTDCESFTAGPTAPDCVASFDICEGVVS